MANTFDSDNTTNASAYKNYCPEDWPSKWPPWGHITYLRDTEREIVKLVSIEYIVRNTLSDKSATKVNC